MALQSWSSASFFKVLVEKGQSRAQSCWFCSPGSKQKANTNQKEARELGRTAVTGKGKNLCPGTILRRTFAWIWRSKPGSNFPGRLSDRLFQDTSSQRGKGRTINIMIYSVMALEGWPLYYYYFFKIPPCGFTHQARRPVFRQPLWERPCLWSPSLNSCSQAQLGRSKDTCLHLLAGARCTAREGSQASWGLWLPAAPGEEPLWLNADWEARLGGW